jgi:excisionase family DNA binding protein
MEVNQSLIGVVETAQILGVSIRTVQRKLSTGQIPGTKLNDGTRAPYLLDRQQVLDLAEKRANK